MGEVSCHESVFNGEPEALATGVKVSEHLVLHLLGFAPVATRNKEQLFRSGEG
jgi:hypothetical protein